MLANKIVIICIILSSALAFNRCHTDRIKPPQEDNVSQMKEPLIKVNKYLVTQDDEKIIAYCKRRKIDIQTNDAGLWYNIISSEKGDSAKTEKIANIKYKLSLLDGKLCYSSDSTGIKSFKIGHGGVEKGLEIGILMMKEGDKAIFIMPPGLAYGLIGDEKCIPARSIIVYEVELLKITDH